MTIPLGPFDLMELAGEGGMASVYAGRHRASHHPVAIKIVTGPQRRRETFHRWFGGEVRAAARLDHPAVVRIHEHGRLPDAAAAALGRPGLAAAPFLVMDWHDGGTLADRLAHAIDHATLRGWLLRLLAGLAHAHAHGIVHRDLKPSNVLFDGRQPVIADFGIAFEVASGESALTSGPVGTPLYMAPEQARNEWRTFGPPTDLYALGCIAYALATGAPPYADAGSLMATLTAHATRPPPPLRPRLPVPQGFEAWIHHLLAKDPADRPPFAADAAEALAALPDPAADPGPPALTDPARPAAAPTAPPAAARPAAAPAAARPANAPAAQSAAPAAPAAAQPGAAALTNTAANTDTAAITDTATLTHLTAAPAAAAPATAAQAAAQAAAAQAAAAQAAAAPAAAAQAAAAALPWDATATLAPPDLTPTATDAAPPPPPPDAPPPAATPATPTATAPAPPTDARRRPLLGVGRTLFGLRPPELHGRAPERDALWTALTAVVRGDGARLVLLEGPSGLGKTRLAHWLARSAHERGLADHLAARHDAAAGPGTGLVAMLARHLHCDGLDGAPRRDRVAAALGPAPDPELVEALDGLFTFEDGWPDDHTLPVPSIPLRNATLAGALAALARRRPLVLILEDLHHGEDTLAFVEHLLTFRRALPVLLIGTLREAHVADEGLGRELIDRLSDGPSARRLTLGPLTPHALTAEIRGRLPLAPDLLAAVITRADGNPLFARALVEHWIQADALEDTRDGFRLRAATTDDLPDAMHTVWRRHLDSVLAGDPTARRALELAAVLGERVDHAEWHASLTHAALAPPAPAALDALLDAGLLIAAAHDGFTFAHDLLRETLLDDARRADRLTRWHRAIAAMLTDRAASPARRARHLLAARDHAAALAPLTAAAEQAIDRKQPARAARALIAHARALRALRRPPEDPACLTLRIEWARLCILRLRPADAARHARRAARAARLRDHPALLVTALIEEARAVAITHDLRCALALILEAIARAADHPHLEVRARKEEGRLRLALGDPDGARHAYETALDRLPPDAPAAQHAALLAALGNLAHRAGDPDRARALVTRARALYRATGNRSGEAHLTNLLGDIARFRGDLSTAEADYRESLRLHGALGSFDALTTEANLALVLSETGHHAEARRGLETAICRATAAGNHELLLIFNACLLPTLATQADWPAWDAIIPTLDPLLAGAYVDPDVARNAERAARLATARGHPARAADAWRLAAAQLRGLGRDPTAATRALADAIARATPCHAIADPTARRAPRA